LVGLFANPPGVTVCSSTALPPCELNVTVKVFVSQCAYIVPLAVNIVPSDTAVPPVAAVNQPANV
jgi:hypothetical protein